MADFNFIVTPELRQCLQSDYRELRACLKAEAWKAVHVLAGSIVEAVLIDALSGACVEQSNLDGGLALLITLAKEKGILPDEAVELSTVIRKYRNLIHPGRVKRLETTVGRSGAIVAAEVVEIITEQVAKRKKETYGYTAEQLLERLRGGESALPLIGHLLSDTQTPEIERLLIDVLPTTYMHAIADPASTADEDRHLLVCYRKLFEAADQEVKRKVMKNLYGIYRTKPEATVLIYENSFFRGSDLVHLSENERGFIKAHLLARVSNETLDRLVDNLTGIGPYVDSGEAYELSSYLMVAMQGEDKSLANRAQHRLLTEYWNMTSESRAQVRSAAEGFGDMELAAKIQEREARIKPKA